MTEGTELDEILAEDVNDAPQVEEQATPPAETQEEEPPKPDIWENPDGFLQQALSPFEQKMKAHEERISYMLAVQEHGKEKVDAAYEAFDQALGSDPSLRAEYQRIMQSQFPHDALVAWHRQHQNRTMVGDDPMKWFEGEFEKRLSDPKEQAKILERIRGGVQPNGQKPVTQLPPSLQRLPAGGNLPDDGDMSDEALFKQAIG